MNYLVVSRKIGPKGYMMNFRTSMTQKCQDIDDLNA